MRFAGRTMLSRTMERIASLLRLRLGRGLCGTHTWTCTSKGAFEISIIEENAKQMIHDEEPNGLADCTLSVYDAET